MLPTNPLLNATAPAGPHLPTGTLRQYAAGTLAPAAQHRVEAHVLACPRCADVLAGLLQTPPATTDQALAQLQQRLRRRVQHAAPAALPATRTRRQNRWLAPQLAAAATLLFGLLAGGWWTWQQRRATPAPAVATQASAPVAAAAPTIASSPPAAAPGAAVFSQAPTATPRHSSPAAVAARHRRFQRFQASPPDTAGNSRSAPSAAAAGAAVVAAAPPQLSEEAAAARADTVRPTLMGRVAGVALAAPSPVSSALVHDRAMPAAPPVPPTPAMGYPSWREKIRREAAEFRPEELPVSGSVQLRLLIGADGKIQEVRVLHGLREDYDAEAQRLVCDGPGWVPGIGGGKRAAQPVEVTVPF